MNLRKKSESFTVWQQEEINSGAFHKALQLLGRRPYTAKQLQQKLLRGFPPSAVRRAIARVKQLQFLDEEAYAHSFIRHQLQISLKGLLWIRRELLKRGLPPAILQRILPEYEDAEVESALRVWEKLKKKRKNQPHYVTGYLKQRGYTVKSIHTLLKGGEE